MGKDRDFPWALNEDGLVLLDRRLAELRPRVAVEFGSGRSTPILRKYSGQTLSVEHLPEWAAKSEALCVGLTGEIRIAEIGEIQTPAGPMPAYDTTLPDEVDFALIDGPPGVIGRGGVMFHLFDSLTSDSVVWLDDVDRNEERRILAMWREWFPIRVSEVSDRIAEIRVDV